MPCTVLSRSISPTRTAHQYLLRSQHRYSGIPRTASKHSLGSGSEPSQASGHRQQYGLLCMGRGFGRLLSDRQLRSMCPSTASGKMIVHKERHPETPSRSSAPVRRCTVRSILQDSFILSLISTMLPRTAYSHISSTSIQCPSHGARP